MIISDILFGIVPALLQKYFTPKDINDILNSEKLFARKFDVGKDSNILDMLDLNNNN